MKLSMKGLALTAAILWGGCIFLVGVLNLVWSGYGTAFLDLVRSIYPGYAGTAGFGGVIVGTLYGIVDGLVCGALFGWFYNALSSSGRGTGAPA